MTATTASCPLAESRRLVDRFSKRIGVLMWAPIPLVAASAAAVHAFDPRWYGNAIVVSILGLFALGQIVAMTQFRSLRRTGTDTIASLRVLEDLPRHPTPEAFRTAIESLPAGHVRNLVLSWIDLGVRDGANRGIQILDNARERRDLVDAKILGFHVSLNRNILKLGFLGTLIGLLFTFPPMRAAVMGLSSSGGEMKFINDIAAAIDEDAYAIQATLISIGFSFLLEAIVVQLLERLLLSFQMVDSHLGDWYLLVLHPWLQRHAPSTPRDATAAGAGSCAEAAAKAHLEFVAMEQRRLAQTVRDAAHDLARRTEELADFETRYRPWLPPETAR